MHQFLKRPSKIFVHFLIAKVIVLITMHFEIFKLPEYLYFLVFVHSVLYIQIIYVVADRTLFAEASLGLKSWWETCTAFFIGFTFWNCGALNAHTHQALYRSKSLF